MRKNLTSTHGFMIKPKNEAIKQRTALFLLTVLGFILTTPCFAADVQNLRGQRYCEILLATQTPPTHFQVYNTIGLGNCPADLWQKITEDSIKKETGASYVRLNGPRYWVIDGMKNSELLNPTPKNFAGIPMREVGVLEVGLMDLVNANKPYKTHSVKRLTTWTYLPGKPIFEILDDKGHTYVMQSYSTQKIEQTEHKLPELAGKLRLPEGWRFRTRFLKKAAHLTPINQQAVVLQDEFLNTYQQETPEFIKTVD